MRVTHGEDTYDLRPDKGRGWILTTVKAVQKTESDNHGQERLTDPIYPATFAYGLQRMLDRMVADGHESDSTLDHAVASVAHMYATIREEARRHAA